MNTPPVSVPVAAWLASIPVEDVAWIAGAAFMQMARSQGLSEADLYADFARRAAEDPDCQVVYG